MALEARQKLAVVTGGAGFIGSHLCERLYAEGWRVISLDNYFTGSRDNHIPGVEYREGHTRDIDKKIPESPDIVYHLGEYSRVEKSFEDPIELIWDHNTAGTFAVLEFCRNRKAKIVYAGSSTKFADGGAGRSQSPYAWSKASNTDLVKNYGSWFGLRYAITYFYNVYGPRELSTGPYATVIGIFKENYKHGRPLTVTAPGTQVRNFTHVDDTVDGLMLVGEKGEGDEYGIGNDKGYSILELAHLFGGEVIMLPERRGNRLQSPVDSTKLRGLGWQPRRSLEEHVQDFVRAHAPEPAPERRVLVFTTTFVPVGGPAEKALGDVMLAMPDVSFDVITTRFIPGMKDMEILSPNVTVYRCGGGGTADKYWLPFTALKTARALVEKHNYAFIWSVLASYAAIAAIRVRASTGVRLPLLITLADQDLQRYLSPRRFILRFIVRHADQISATSKYQESEISRLSPSNQTTLSNRTGDAFANQIRFLYNALLKKYL